MEALDPAAATKESESHTSTVFTLSYSRRHVFSGGGDCTVRVWDAHTLACVKVLRGHAGAVVTLTSTYDFLISSGRDNMVRVWDLDSLETMRVLKGE